MIKVKRLSHWDAIEIASTAAAYRDYLTDSAATDNTAEKRAANKLKARGLSVLRMGIPAKRVVACGSNFAFGRLASSQ